MKDSGAHVDAPWRYERIEGAGHWMQLDAPDRVSELLVEFLRVNAVELRAAFAARELSPVETIDAAAEHAELGAFITLTLDAAREQARAAERAYARGEARPLEGLTLAVKDLFDTAGVRTTYGSTHLRRPRARRRRGAGAPGEGGGRDRRRQDAHARVRVGHHERQPALPAVPEPARPRARARRLERRLRGRAGDRRGGARARAPTPAARSGSRPRSAACPGSSRRTAGSASTASIRSRRRSTTPGRWRARPPTSGCFWEALTGPASSEHRAGSRSAPICTCDRSSPGSSARSTPPSPRST